MKKLYFTLLLLPVLLNSACKKTVYCCVLPKVPNYISALKNNAKWNAPSQIYKTPTATDTVILSGHIGEETLNITLKRTASNSYNLIDATYFITIGQDALGSQYNLDKSKANVFSSPINTDSKIIEGTFSLYFKRFYSMPTNAVADTLSFKSGIFKATWQ
ncbi:MAG: hypothetical protein JWR38_2218 [Mucilaginibacter sp.]|nr:hypothetical protein [Mucilaginibacter sp.]